MLYDQQFQSTNMAITHIRAMLIDSHEFSNYQLTRFPFELNGLVSIKTLYPSLVMCIDHMQMPMKTNSSRCKVLNALVAYWPSELHTQAAIVEFQSIQKAMEIEPNIIQCKKILYDLIRDKWGVQFKGKELIVC